MKSFLSLVGIALVMFNFVCCTNRKMSAYQSMLIRIPDSISVDTSKNLSFLIYSPLTCLSCNSILSNLIEDTTYNKAMGQNTFIVFPSIRPIELADYQKNLSDYGHVRLNYINDKTLYDFLNAKRTNPKDAKPVLIAVKKSNDQYVCIGLREANLIDSVQKYFD